MIITGNVFEVLKKMSSESVQEIITSSPYLGLRCYGTEPVVWGGDPTCEHDWTTVHPPGYRGSDTSPGPMQHEGNTNRERFKSDFCAKCGAWKGELGMEPTPELFVEHLTEIYHEGHRVLRKDGIFLANIGDSFSRNPEKGGSGTPTGRNNRGEHYPGGCHGGMHLKEKDLIEIPSLLAASLRAPYLRCKSCGHVAHQFKWGKFPDGKLICPKCWSADGYEIAEDGWYLRARLPWLKRNCVGQQTILYVKSQKGAMPMSVIDMTKLRVGTFSLWNGDKWTTVVDLTPLETLQHGLEIEFRGGYKITVTEEHRWPVVGKGLVTTKDICTGDIIQSTTLPDTNFLQTEQLPDRIGRIIGLFIAEGAFLKSDDDDAGICFTFSCKETHLDKEVNEFATIYGGSHHSHTYDGKMMSIIHGKVPIAIIRHFTENKGSKKKRLANTCWRRNNLFLTNLLEGYLDGDGHFDKKNNRWRLGFCKNDDLASDVRIICSRLGFSLRLKRGVCTAEKGGKIHDIWRGQIRKEQVNKDGNNSGCFKHASDFEVISIKPTIHKQRFYNIGVEDSPHLFALLNGALTHNSLPSSVTDRPSSSIEYFFLLSKSGDTQFWTHPKKNGTRKKPEPDYIYINRITEEKVAIPPEDWKTTTCIHDGKEKKLWKRRNLWEGHDYFYDHIAVMQKSSESYDKDKRPRGVLRQRVNPKTKYPNEGQFEKIPDTTLALRKQDNTGNVTYTGFNDRYVPNGLGLRYMRDSDFFFKTWQGLLQNENGEPMALVVNPKGYKGAHFAVFPIRLVEPLLLAGTSGMGACPKCGAQWAMHDVGCEFRPTCDCDAGPPIPAMVLDTFNGSGSTGVACKVHNRLYIGIELNPDYVKLSNERIAEGK